MIGLDSLGQMLAVPDIFRPRRGGPGLFDWKTRNPGSIATGNRHTGKPHKHEREIARRAKRSS